MATGRKRFSDLGDDDKQSLLAWVLLIFLLVAALALVVVSMAPLFTGSIHDMFPATTKVASRRGHQIYTLSREADSGLYWANVLFANPFFFIPIVLLGCGVGALIVRVLKWALGPVLEKLSAVEDQDETGMADEREQANGVAEPRESRPGVNKR